MELRDVDPALLDLADRVCVRLLVESETLMPSDLMLVGAHCRDILWATQGQNVQLRTTDDVDFGVALANWVAYDDLTSRLEPAGDTGIRFQVEGVPTDLMPFGPIEKPVGEVTPQGRNESMSVWAFQEVFDHADQLTLPRAGTIRIPTIPGYAALKLAAWLDRSAGLEYKDAADLAVAMQWYSDSEAMIDRLYADDAGTDILVRYEVDTSRGAVHLLGQDVAELIGSERCDELRHRWPGDRATLLPVEMNLPPATGWPPDTGRRIGLLNALESGLGLDLTAPTIRQ